MNDAVDQQEAVEILSSTITNDIALDLAKMLTDEINRYAVRSREVSVTFGTICLASVAFFSRVEGFDFSQKVLIVASLGVCGYFTWSFIKTSGARGRYARMLRQAALRRFRLSDGLTVEFSGDLIGVELDCEMEKKFHKGTWGINAIYTAFVVLLWFISGVLMLR